jgi:hypothetical protein
MEDRCFSTDFSHSFRICVSESDDYGGEVVSSMVFGLRSPNKTLKRIPLRMES